MSSQRDRDAAFAIQHGELPRSYWFGNSWFWAFGALSGLVLTVTTESLLPSGDGDLGSTSGVQWSVLVLTLWIVGWWSLACVQEGRVLRERMDIERRSDERKRMDAARDRVAAKARAEKRFLAKKERRDRRRDSVLRRISEAEQRVREDYERRLAKILAQSPQTDATSPGPTHASTRPSPEELNQGHASEVAARARQIIDEERAKRADSLL